MKIKNSTCVCIVFALYLTGNIHSVFGDDLKSNNEGAGLTDVEQDIAIAGSEESTWDQVHDSGLSTLSALTDDIDNFFGDVRRDEEKRNDWFRIGVETGLREGDSLLLQGRIRANIDLSDYGKNLRFFIAGDGKDRTQNGQPVDSPSEDTFLTSERYQGDTGSTGVSYDFIRSPNLLVSANAGFKFNAGPHPFGDIRASKWFDLGDHFSFEPTQFLQYVQGDGLGEKTRLDLNFKLGERERLRSRTEGLYSESSQGLEVLEEISWLRKFSDRTYAGVAASVTGYTDPQWTKDVYRLAFRYRQLVYKDFLFLETEPGIEFPDDRGYQTTPYILFKLDMYFDR